MKGLLMKGLLIKGLLLKGLLLEGFLIKGLLHSGSIRPFLSLVMYVLFFFKKWDTIQGGFFIQGGTLFKERRYLFTYFNNEK